MEAAKAARAEIREPRFAVEKVRKAAKAPLLAIGRRIDAEAVRITEAILAIEEPIDGQIKAEEARKVAEREAKRAAEVERLRLEAVDRLKNLGLKKLVILTGDRKSVAKRVAEQMHFSEFKAEVLPHEKLEMVDELKAKGHRVAVIGDGVNDAPALAAGDISSAMGAAGSDVAIHSASIALLNSNLNRIPFLVELSRRTIGVIRQNMRELGTEMRWEDLSPQIQGQMRQQAIDSLKQAGGKVNPNQLTPDQLRRIGRTGAFTAAATPSAMAEALKGNQ
jgi:cation transport ATPase